MVNTFFLIKIYVFHEKFLISDKAKSNIKTVLVDLKLTPSSKLLV